jgi:DNA-binding SARP family transcriptional activator
MVQALAKGYVSTAAEIREVVRRSTELVEYEPRDTRGYQELYGEYLRLLEKAPQ